MPLWTKNLSRITSSLFLFFLVVSSTSSSSSFFSTPFSTPPPSLSLSCFNEIVLLPGQMIDWQGSQPASHSRSTTMDGSRVGVGGRKKKSHGRADSTLLTRGSPGLLPSFALHSHPDDCVRSPLNEYFIYLVSL